DDVTHHNARFAQRDPAAEVHDGDTLYLSGAGLQLLQAASSQIGRQYSTLARAEVEARFRRSLDKKRPFTSSLGGERYRKHCSEHKKESGGEPLSCALILLCENYFGVALK